MSEKIPPEVLQKTRQLYYDLGSQRAVADKLGISRRTVRDRLASSEDMKPLYSGRIETLKTPIISPPKRGATRFILTSAQNNTPVHKQFFENLRVFGDFIQAKYIWVSRFTYNHNAYGQLATKPGTAKKQGSIWYDPILEKYFNDDSVEIAPGLVWCGEMNILPTAERPLRGFETYTGRKSGVFPHSKVAMESVASGKYEPTKFNYTTGAVTLRNYIQKKAGLKAEFHHTYGALLVEVDSEGDWFARQLIADEDGTFQDLNVRVEDETIYQDRRIEAITWGDLHTDMIDEDVARVSWNDGGILDTLQPRYQFFHDVLNFGRRSHHEIDNPHRMFEQFVEGNESVEREIEKTAIFLGHRSYRPWCESIVVDSNHDNHFTRWLRETDYRKDPVNAIWFLESQLRLYKAIESRDKQFHLVEWALRQKGAPDDIRFLRQDQGFIICPEYGGGIECGMHGDLGPNGVRGTPQTLRKIGRRANTAHTHIAGIYDGLFVAGTSSKLDMKFNSGPSSWSQAHILTYSPGKRAIATVWNGKWRA